MEHRYHPRMQVALKVDLYRREQPLGHTLTKDVSLSGMMLKNEQPALERNELISLRIGMNGVEQTLRGLVIYTNPRYAGIMLIDVNEETTRVISDFLKELKAPNKKVASSMTAGREI